LRITRPLTPCCKSILRALSRNIDSLRRAAAQLRFVAAWILILLLREAVDLRLLQQYLPAADIRQTTCKPEPDLIHQTLFVTAEFDAPRPTETTGRNARHQTFGRFVRTSFSPPPAMRLSRAGNCTPTSSA